MVLDDILEGALIVAILAVEPSEVILDVDFEPIEIAQLAGENAFLKLAKGLERRVLCLLLGFLGCARLELVKEVRLTSFLHALKEVVSLGIDGLIDVAEKGFMAGRRGRLLALRSHCRK